MTQRTETKLLTPRESDRAERLLTQLENLLEQSDHTNPCPRNTESGEDPPCCCGRHGALRAVGLLAIWIESQRADAADEPSNPED